jgi:hypothetical protein
MSDLPARLKAKQAVVNELDWQYIESIDINKHANIIEALSTDVQRS